MAEQIEKGPQQEANERANLLDYIIKNYDKVSNPDIFPTEVLRKAAELLIDATLYTAAEHVAADSKKALNYVQFELSMRPQSLELLIEPYDDIGDIPELLATLDNINPEV